MVIHINWKYDIGWYRVILWIQGSVDSLTRGGVHSLILGFADPWMIRHARLGTFQQPGWSQIRELFSGNSCWSVIIILYLGWKWGGFVAKWSPYPSTYEVIPRDPGLPPIFSCAVPRFLLEASWISSSITCLIKRDENLKVTKFAKRAANGRVHVVVNTHNSLGDEDVVSLLIWHA